MVSNETAAHMVLRRQHRRPALCSGFVTNGRIERIEKQVALSVRGSSYPGCDASKKDKNRREDCGVLWRDGQVNLTVICVIVVGEAV